MDIDINTDADVDPGTDVETLNPTPLFEGEIIMTDGLVIHEPKPRRSRRSNLIDIAIRGFSK